MTEPPIGQDLLEELDLTDAERKFLDQANTHVTSQGVQAGAIANVYLARKLRDVADDVIRSEKCLAASQGRYAKALNWLTGALVLATVAQVVAVWLTP